MKIQDQAQICGRLAIADDDASKDLATLLEKWVQKHFVKKASGQMLGTLRSTGALPSLVSWLRSRPSEADILAIIRKLDPHNKEILKADRAQMLAHVEALSSGTAPVSKTKPASKKSAAKSSSAGARR